MSEREKIIGEFFDAMLRDALAYGDPAAKIVFVSPVTAMVITQNDDWVAPAPGSPHDRHVAAIDRSRLTYTADRMLNGAYGFQLPMIVRRDWAQHGDVHRAVVLDLDTLENWRMPEVPA